MFPDNRYEDDIHWKGGCVLGGGMLSWASSMFCWDGRAPHPQYNNQWRTLWRERLEGAGESCARTWLQHRTYDSYWRHGSVGEDYSRIQVPVLVFGGWHDGYTNAALRLADRLPDCRAVIGRGDYRVLAQKYLTNFSFTRPPQNLSYVTQITNTK